MEHIIKFEAGYDCIRFECVSGSKRCVPGGGGSHGRHGLTFRFYSKGSDGAVQFVLYTGWPPQPVSDKELFQPNKWDAHEPIPAGLGYHSKKPRYEAQSVVDDHCEFCDGQPCYYDGSALNADLAMLALVNGGGEALWKFLDEFYVATFAGGEWPKPAEYRMPVRAIALEAK